MFDQNLLQSSRLTDRVSFAIITKVFIKYLGYKVLKLHAINVKLFFNCGYKNDYYANVQIWKQKITNNKK